MTIDNRITQINDCAQVWTHNRSVYPGWIIAPRQNRQIIWHNTQDWLEPIIQSAPSLPLHDRISVLHELVWRLQVVLAPIWTNPDVASILTNCLAEARPFFEINGRIVHDQNYPWETTRRWFDLTFWMLRHYRDERNFAAFEDLAANLLVLAPLVEDSIPRLCYERCLASMARMNDLSLNSALSDWPEECSDPIWDVRRASVLAELDRSEEAIALAETAVKRLRFGRPGPDRIDRLSREGWAIRLIESLTSLKNLGKRTDYTGRLEFLSKYRCDPTLDLQNLEWSIETLRRELGESVSAQFYPGDFQLTHRLSVSAELLPAYQYFRIVEDGARPSRSGTLDIAGSHLRKAAERVIGIDDCRVWTVLFRQFDLKLLETFLTREKVATLSAETVDDAFQIATTTIDLALKASPTVTTPRTSRSAKQLKFAVELLLRVAVRLPQEIMVQQVRRAIALYGSRSHYDDPDLVQSVKNLLRNMKLGIGAAEFKRLVPDLLAAKSFVPLPSHIPDAIASVLTSTDSSRPDAPPTDLEIPPAIVESLLGDALSDDDATRRRAVVRLEYAFGNGLLNDDQQQRFSSALWGRIDARTSLPIATGLRDSAFLTLPQPSNGLAAERIRAFLLNQDIPRLSVRIKTAEGKLQTKTTINSDPQYVLHTWILASRRPTSDVAGLIDWSSDDAWYLFDKLRSWWSDERDVLANDFGPFASDFPRERLRLVQLALRDIVFPRADTTERQREASEFAAEISTRGANIEFILPALLWHGMSDVSTVAERLTHALHAGDLVRGNDALAGISYWIYQRHLAQRGQHFPALPPIPLSVLNEVGAIIAGRRSQLLLPALEIVELLLRLEPESVSEVLLNSINIGLEFLLLETDYSAVPTAQVFGGNEKSNYRRMCAAIATRMHTAQRSTEVTNRWIAAAQIDPLPEVRLALDVDCGPLE